jgi:hypothetical protein
MLLTEEKKMGLPRNIHARVDIRQQVTKLPEFVEK